MTRALITDRSMVNDSEAMLAWLREAVRCEGDFAVEIGSYCGQGSVAMAKLLQGLPTRNHRLWSIDPFVEQPPSPGLTGDYGVFATAVTEAGAWPIITVLTTTSHNAAQWVPGGAAFIVFDGSHLYDDILQDCVDYWPKIRVGGYAFFDDYSSIHHADVQRAVDEYFRHHAEWVIAARESNALIVQKQAVPA